MDQVACRYLWRLGDTTGCGCQEVASDQRARIAKGSGEGASGKGSAQFAVENNTANPSIGGWRGLSANGLWGYSLAIWTWAERKTPAPETCDAIRNAATTAGTLISLRN